MLGYEPTIVDSKAYITDYSKYIEDKRISIETFFGENLESNLVEDISSLNNYKTEIKLFNKGDYKILIANNCRSYKMPTFGVFHNAEIQKK